MTWWTRTHKLADNHLGNKVIAKRVVPILNNTSPQERISKTMPELQEQQALYAIQIKSY